MRFTVEFDSLEDIQELESKLAKLDDLIDAVEDLRQLNEELRRMVVDQLQNKLEEEGYPPE